MEPNQTHHLSFYSKENSIHQKKRKKLGRVGVGCLQSQRKPQKHHAGNAPSPLQPQNSTSPLQFSIIKNKRKINSSLVAAAVLLLMMMIPNLYGGLFVLVRPRPFLLHLQFPQLRKRERKRERERERKLGEGTFPFSLSLSLHLSLSLSTHLYFSIIASLSLSLSLIRICLYLYDLSSGSCSFSHLDLFFFFFLLFYFLAPELLAKMMRRARKVAMDSSPSSSPLLVGDEARARFKHQALLQDYEELLRETEAKKRQLQKTIQKKLKLTAEVKFLRRKYKFFTRNPSHETPCRLKRLPRKKPSPSVTFAHPQNSISNANHRLQDKNQRAKETETRSASALFDLNKVSFPNAEEMEGIQVEWEPPKVDKLKRYSVDGEVAAHDLNLSIFKDVGNNSSSHVGKRKISWQDQVALRV